MEGRSAGIYVLRKLVSWWRKRNVGIRLAEIKGDGVLRRDPLIFPGGEGSPCFLCTVSPFFSSAWWDPLAACLVSGNFWAIVS